MRFMPTTRSKRRSQRRERPVERVEARAVGEEEARPIGGWRRRVAGVPPLKRLLPPHIFRIGGALRPLARNRRRRHPPRHSHVSRNAATAGGGAGGGKPRRRNADAFEGACGSMRVRSHARAAAPPRQSAPSRARLRRRSDGAQPPPAAAKVVELAREFAHPVRRARGDTAVADGVAVRSRRRRARRARAPPPPPRRNRPQ